MVAQEEEKEHGHGETSVSSESSFRELDDVFLQTQTRIWLGEVLRTRLDDQLHVADLLADGELLFEVSREVWEMLVTKRMEIRGAKPYKYEPFASRKSSGRYLPYSNVDSFLKICKFLGLAGVDLFSPSDVVEKKDTRKVCMCIRSLSKKARSRHLNVPDFDVVTYTVAMPTAMVGCMRRSWELSRCTSSGSFSDDSSLKSRRRSQQKYSNSASGQCSSSFSEELDDAESKFLSQSDRSTTNFCYNSSSQLNSSGESLVVEDYSSEQVSSHLGCQNQQEDECVKCQLEAVCLNSPAGSLGSQYLEYDSQPDSMLSGSFVNSNVYLGDDFSLIESAARSSHKAIALNPIFADANLEDAFSVVGDCGNGSTARKQHIDDHLSFLSNVHQGSYTSDSILLDGEDSVFRACVNTGFCTSKATKMTFKSEVRYRYSDVGEEEVSSISSVGSVSGVVRNLDFDDPLGTDDGLKNVGSPESQNSVVAQFKTVIEEANFPNSELSALDMKATHTDLSSKHVLKRSDRQHTDGHTDHGILRSQIESTVVYKDWKVFANQSPLPKGSHQWDQKGKCGICTLSTGNDGHGAASVLLSQVDLQDEMQIKATGGFWRANEKPFILDNNVEVNDASLVESNRYAGKELTKWFETACFDNVEERRDDYEDSNASCNIMAAHNLVELAQEKLTFSATEQSQDVDGNSDEVPTDQKKDMICHTEHKDKVDNKHEKNSVESEKLGVARASSKPQRMSLIGSVAKGAAVIGVMFFLLHLRTKDGENAGEFGKPSSNRMRKVKGRDLSSKRQKGRRAAGVYPSGKLKF